ncbi:MAG: Ribose operon repressor [Candidatus Celerinatantimonas neptuna]|nr:MAG: Ribose operon repressor [Candidatus Celerinatantimonas neptuna]
MATMKDVARMAGVSISTVSHVLNQTRFVSDDVASRVKAAAEELRYSPSALARSLKMKMTHTLGMLLTTSSNPFFAELLKGVERRCYEKGYNLILCNTEGDSKRMQANLDMLLQKRVDGLLLMCCEWDDPEQDLFYRHQPVPTVVMDWGPQVSGCDRIQDNSRQGGYLATRYLIDQGFTQIGCLAGPLDRPTAIRRLEGFKKAMNEASLPVCENWVVSGNYDCMGGQSAFRELYHRGALPSALFICNDMMAMGAIHSAYQLGLSIPEQLSIVGYDDIQLAQYSIPALTTVHQPKFRLGQQAVDRLLERIQCPDIDTRVIELEPSLVVRDSVQSI